jgi:carbonic anhydrase/acetyltransferase-like protein (isoleucine patch superfamily)
VIGMRATVSDYAHVGRWAIVGEAALIRSGQEIPPEVIAVGVPARVVGAVREEQRALWTHGKALYQDLARRYPEGLREVARDELDAPEPG